MNSVRDGDRCERFSRRAGVSAAERNNASSEAYRYVWRFPVNLAVASEADCSGNSATLGERWAPNG